MVVPLTLHISTLFVWKGKKMGDMRDVFEGYRELHKQRVAENPKRLEYAVKLLKENGITFKVCNEQTAQINCYFANGKTLTFYAGTGKIQGYKNLRGVHNFVRLCKGEKINDKIHIRDGAEVWQRLNG